MQDNPNCKPKQGTPRCACLLRNVRTTLYGQVAGEAEADRSLVGASQQGVKPRPCGEQTAHLSEARMPVSEARMPVNRNVHNPLERAALALRAARPKRAC